MADDNGIYYYFPCCARAVADGDENTYWLALRENQGDTAEIQFDFDGYEYNISRVEIEILSCENIQCTVYGFVGGAETEIFSGKPGNIEFEIGKVEKIRIVFRIENGKELKIKKNKYILKK